MNSSLPPSSELRSTSTLQVSIERVDCLEPARHDSGPIPCFTVVLGSSRAAFSPGLFPDPKLLGGDTPLRRSSFFLRYLRHPDCSDCSSWYTFGSINKVSDRLGVRLTMAPRLYCADFPQYLRWARIRLYRSSTVGRFYTMGFCGRLVPARFLSAFFSTSCARLIAR